MSNSSENPSTPLLPSSSSAAGGDEAESPTNAVAELSIVSSSSSAGSPATTSSNVGSIEAGASPSKGNNSHELDIALAKCTNPLISEFTDEQIDHLCALCNASPEGPQTVLQILAYKAQSPQEYEALHALRILEQVVKRGGARILEEIGRFRFLNELIKIVSQNFAGFRVSPKVRARIVEILFYWSMTYKERPKIYEAYQMLKVQKVVLEDPVHVLENYRPPTPPEPRARDAIFDDETTVNTLKKLIDSKNPQQLEAANKLIQSLADKVESRREFTEKFNVEIESITNYCELVSDMVEQCKSAMRVDPETDRIIFGGATEEDLALIRELYDNLVDHRMSLLKVSGQINDFENDLDGKQRDGISSLDRLIQTSDMLNYTINRTKAFLDSIESSQSFWAAHRGPGSSARASTSHAMDTSSGPDAPPLYQPQPTAAHGLHFDHAYLKSKTTSTNDPLLGGSPTRYDPTEERLLDLSSSPARRRADKTDDEYLSDDEGDGIYDSVREHRKTRASHITGDSSVTLAKLFQAQNLSSGSRVGGGGNVPERARSSMGESSSSSSSMPAPPPSYYAPTSNPRKSLTSPTPPSTLTTSKSAKESSDDYLGPTESKRKFFGQSTSGIQRFHDPLDELEDINEILMHQHLGGVGGQDGGRSEYARKKANVKTPKSPLPSSVFGSLVSTPTCTVTSEELECKTPDDLRSPENGRQSRLAYRGEDDFATAESLGRLLSMYGQIAPNTIVPCESRSTKQRPMRIFAEDGIQITLHYTGNRPHPQVLVFLVTITNFNAVPVSNVQFVAAVKKDIKIKLLSQSGTFLPAFDANPPEYAAALAHVPVLSIDVEMEPRSAASRESPQRSIQVPQTFISQVLVIAFSDKYLERNRVGRPLGHHEPMMVEPSMEPSTARASAAAAATGGGGNTKTEGESGSESADLSEGLGSLDFNSSHTSLESIGSEGMRSSTSMPAVASTSSGVGGGAVPANFFEPPTSMQFSSSVAELADTEYMFRLKFKLTYKLNGRGQEHTGYYNWLVQKRFIDGDLI